MAYVKKKGIFSRHLMFKIKDYSGTKVTLTKETWFKKLLDPVIGHLEVKPYLAEIGKTISAPDFVYQSKRDPRSKIFYKAGLTRGKFAKCLITVVVKYVREKGKVQGFVSTTLLTTNLPRKGKLLWERKVSH